MHTKLSREFKYDWKYMAQSLMMHRHSEISRAADGTLTRENLAEGTGNALKKPVYFLPPLLNFLPSAATPLDALAAPFFADFPFLLL
jgi:hypothetical protein